MKFYFRRADILIIICLSILIIAFLCIDEIFNLNVSPLLSPLLVLIFIIIYLQTFRSLQTKVDQTRIDQKEINRRLDSLARNSKKRTDITIEEIKYRTDNLYYQLDSLASIYTFIDGGKHLIPQFRSWAISPDFGRLLITNILRYKPNLILDVGSGVSSYISGICIKELGKGKIVSIDHDEKYHKLSYETLKEHQLDQYIDNHYTPLKEYMIDGNKYQWYDIDSIELEKIDLLIVDGPPGTLQQNSRLPAIPLLADKLNNNCIIMVDDYKREDEKEMVKYWISEYGLDLIEVVNTEKGYCTLQYRNVKN